MPGFWSWKRKSNLEESPAEEAEVTPVLESVEIFTSDRLIRAQVEAGGKRLSDILNGTYDLVIFNPQSFAFDGAADMNESLEGEYTINTDDIRIVLPPMRVSSRQMRVHRRRRRVEAQLGELFIAGSVHLNPGAELNPMAWRKQMRFIPLTNVYVRRDGENVIEREADVVLVNVGPINELREVDVS